MPLLGPYISSLGRICNPEMLRNLTITPARAAIGDIVYSTERKSVVAAFRGTGNGFLLIIRYVITQQSCRSQYLLVLRITGRELKEPIDTDLERS